MNETLMRGVDSSLIDKTSWWNRIPLMREYDRPDYVFNVLLLWIKEKVKPYKIKEDNPTLPNQIALERLQKNYDEPLDEARYRTLLLDMKEKIGSLQQSGVTVVLFAPPNAPEIKNSKCMSVVQDVCYEVFPPDQYLWQEFDWSQYRTNDGVHLQDGSAGKLAEEIIRMTEEGVTDK